MSAAAKRLFVSLAFGLSSLTGWASPPYGYHSYSGMGMWRWGGGLFGWFFFLLAALLLIGIVGALLRLIYLAANKGAGSTKRSTSSALAILEERLARGEIDAKEFEEKKRLLTH